MAWNKGKFGRQPWHNIKGLNNGKPWNKGIKNKENVICICGKSFYPPKKTSTFCSKHCAMKNNKRSVKENNLI